MWTCPACGRAFKKRRQTHFCGDPPESVQAYIAQQPEAVRPFLLWLHEQIMSTARDMEPRIAWRMPTYWKGQNILQFAAYQNFVSLYAGKEALETFRDQLTAFEVAGGTLRLPYDRPLPDRLIRGITRWCYRHYALRGDSDNGTEKT